METADGRREGCAAERRKSAHVARPLNDAKALQKALQKSPRSREQENRKTCIADWGSVAKSSQSDLGLHRAAEINPFAIATLPFAYAHREKLLSVSARQRACFSALGQMGTCTYFRSKCIIGSEAVASEMVCKRGGCISVLLSCLGSPSQLTGCPMYAETDERARFSKELHPPLAAAVGK